MLLAFAGSAAAQQSYPNKPIRLVVPFPPGSATDVVGRILGQSVAAAIGQPVLIDNKAGADGAIGGSGPGKGQQHACDQYSRNDPEGFHCGVSQGGIDDWSVLNGV
jgi:tripartite-type tricarboxylate transporter receptor subunit TctC